MERRLDRFLAGSPRSRRLGSLGLVVAAVGAALGFNIDYSSGNPLAYAALGRSRLWNSDWVHRHRTGLLRFLQGVRAARCLTGGQDEVLNPIGRTFGPFK